MSEVTVAVRYAKALIDLAQEQNALEEVKNDIVLFYKTLKISPELNAVLGNPVISHSKKVSILAEIFGSRISKVSIALLNIMVNKGRGDLLFDTAHEFIGLYDIKNHITYAKVVSAAPLSEANRKEIQQQVEQSVGGTIKLNTQVDPSLIGGFVLTIGDRRIDTSVSNSLMKLKKEFAQAATK